MRLAFALIGVALLCANCATVTRGTTSDVQIITEPPGAEARLSTGQVCNTPCTVNMSRRQEFTVAISKPGFRSEQVEVKTQVAGAGAAGMAGNIILGGVVGIVADAATGATLEHVPNPLRMTLQPAGPQPRTPANRRTRQPEAAALPESVRRQQQN